MVVTLLLDHWSPDMVLRAGSVVLNRRVPPEPMAPLGAGRPVALAHLMPAVMEFTVVEGERKMALLLVPEPSGGVALVAGVLRPPPRHLVAALYLPPAVAAVVGD